LFAVVVFAVVVCAQLFVLRQQRLELMHEVASLRSGISRSRHTLWDLETSIAQSTRPAVLRQAISRVQLRFEPVVSPALMQGRQMTTADTKPALSLHR
jgi:cell division protein FtsL